MLAPTCVAGVVLVRCSCCSKLHLIADNLGWFGDRTNIEHIMLERGVEVSRNDDVMEHEPS